jgi:hypothetical protein
MTQFEVELREISTLTVVVEATGKREAYQRARDGGWIWQSDAGMEIEAPWPVRGSARQLAPSEEVEPQ